ncbi:MAG: polysaccharide pyruvyl transferase family protein [Gammaproteobacteria bacterium]|nr:polysaccharide pyruvyl transferase family protein [Gammaproteobacteria bacterium]
MRVAHIASHFGNFGDTLSSQAFEHELLLNDPSTSIRKIEIRDYYTNGRFNGLLSVHIEDLCQIYDQVVIGGGGFLTPYPVYKDNHSKSLIEFTDKCLSNYSGKISLLSIGYEGQLKGIDERILLDQMKYLEKASQSGMLINFREDAGTTQLIEKEIITPQAVYPDFALATKKLEVEKTRNIVICPSGGRGNEGWDLDKPFIKSVYELCLLLIENDYSVTFILHTLFDLKTTGLILDGFKSIEYRRKVNVINAFNGGINIADILKLYAKSVATIAGRYHGAIAAITQDSLVLAPHLSAKASVMAKKFNGILLSNRFEAQSALEEIEQRNLKHFAPQKASINQLISRLEN